jgi:hypothetical protein
MTQEAREPRTAPQRAKLAAEKTAVPAAEQAATAGATTSTTPAAARQRPGTAQVAGQVTARPERCLLASAAHTDERDLAGLLSRDAGIKVLRTFVPQHSLEPRYGGPATAARIAVIEAGPAQAAALSALPGLYVEPDPPLEYGEPRLVPAGLGTVPHGESVPVTVTVRDDAERPIAAALVHLLCPGTAAAGLTDKDGWATLSVPKDLVETALLLEVRPRGGHYDSALIRPRLTGREPHVVTCRRLTAALPDFPERAHVTWAERVLGLDRVPPTFRGHGVRVGLIDSGAHAGHPDLADRLADGRDVLGQDDKSWRQDALGNGTACAALIVGTDDRTGIVGLAPEAELHCLKVMPGGYGSDLIEALDYAIAERLDLVQLSVNCAAAGGLGGTGPGGPLLLAQKLEQARQAGVACVVAAGDGAGPVPFPANLPQVLTVGAVGLHGTFPPESRSALEAGGPASPEGLFVPGFANGGPEVDVCAPGVAIISAVPHGGYSALDGTALAAAHVTAVATLVLAHHPVFRDGRGPQGAERVDHLFGVLKASARRPLFGPYGAADPAHCGAGIPDAAQCVTSYPAAWAGPPAPAANAAVFAAMGLGTGLGAY